MKNIKYPAKPWTDGQKAELMSGLSFMYSSSLRKWVPISPGAVQTTQIQEAFGVSTVDDLLAKYNTHEIKINELDSDNKVNKVRLDNADSDIERTGRIWKTLNRPTKPGKNDIWIDETIGKAYSYDYDIDTWIQL